MLLDGRGRMQPYCDSGLIIRLCLLDAVKNAGGKLARRKAAAAAKILFGLGPGGAVTQQYQHLLSLQGQLHTFGLVCLSCAKPGWW